MTVELIKEKTLKCDITGAKCTVEVTLARYKVSRKVLSESSRVWDTSLRGNFQESKSSSVRVYFGTVKSLELWFRVVHDTMIEEMYDLNVEEVYEAIEVCGNRDWDILKLKNWSREWMNRQNYRHLSLDGMSELIYIAKELDFPREFMFMTKKLVYGIADHIKDKNPTNHFHLHLDHTVISRFIQCFYSNHKLMNKTDALNGAKGNLRCKILKGLFTPVGGFLDQKCTCRKDSLYEYCQGLSKTGIWPLESHMKKAAQTLLDTFGDFECETPDDACRECRSRLQDASIQRTRENVQNSFDGLCLDCMDNSKPKDGKNADNTYWQHDVLRQWSRGCRVEHDQPTWYWSFMGRRTQMQAHQAARQR